MKNNIIKKLLKKHEFYLLSAIILLSTIITVVNPSFMNSENLLDLFKSYAFMGILSVGVLVVLISGGIDISFTAIATIAEYVMALTIVRYTGNPILAFLIAGICGIILGFINALFIHNFRIPTIIVTIATLNIFNGLLRVFSNGRWIYNLPTWFQDFARIQFFSKNNSSGSEFGLSIFLLLWLALILLTWFILQKTMLGRNIYALGGNPAAAERVGIPIFKTQAFVYSYMGFIAGIAGVVHALQVQTVAPNAIVGKELNVLAAVLLGGASLAGGAGTLTGAFLGVTLMAIISNGLTLLKVPSAFNEVTLGIIIVLSVGVTSIQMNQQNRHRHNVNIDEEDS